MIRSRPLTAILIACLAGVTTLRSEDVISPAEVREITGAAPREGAELSAPRNILFCWSGVDHPEGVHDYEGFAKTYAAILGGVTGITATSVEGFPSEDQWDTADLVVFYLTLNALTDEQLTQLDEHLAQGRSIIVVHQALVQRKGYGEWADRIGFAYSWEQGETRSKWGSGELAITLDTDTEILRGFPAELRFQEELYWNLKPGRQGTVTVLAESPAPDPKGGGADARWPVFWKVEHQAHAGVPSGRVFCSVIGHRDDFQTGAFFRLVMLRGIAWCLREDPGVIVKTAPAPSASEN